MSWRRSVKIIKFRTKNPDVDIRAFRYDSRMTIKEMLYDFLGETNSKLIIDPKEIMFIYSTLILNNEDNLNKTVGEVFRGSKINYMVGVEECYQIPGGP